jgi:hypothetical protein
MGKTEVVYYNQRRRHSTVGYIGTVAFENRFVQELRKAG